MTVILRKLFEKVLDKDVRLVAGAKGLENSVSWFHMVESLEVAAFLQGQEVIFTTGVALKPGELLALVKTTWERKASGVIVNIGPYIAAVPEEVAAFCDERHYPLFTIDWQASIPHIMRLFATQILASEKAGVEMASALKCAISFPQNKDRYINTFVQYGFEEWDLYCMAVVELIEKPARPKERELIQTIENILMSAGDKSFVINAEGVLMFLFANYSDEAIRAIMLKIIANLRGAGQAFYAGIGLSVQSIANLSVSYRQARKVVSLNRKTDTRSMVVNYKELGLYKLLLAVDEAGIQEYCRETMGVLEAHDRANRTNYVKVLEGYLRNNCSIHDTAAMLGVHRNTINYKIRKIEEVLDCNLSDLDVRVNIYVAYLIKNILE